MIDKMLVPYHMINELISLIIFMFSYSDFNYTQLLLVNNTFDIEYKI